ncbi:MAG: hypothetical protein SFW65_07855 [Alphaproteobacteria bacterium]|nr:hypothetical protein [Alphaproteobacteria bacterium]
MSIYSELPTLSELRNSSAFLKLAKVHQRLKNGGHDKRSFRTAEEAIVELNRLKGFVGQGSSDTSDALGNHPKKVEEWGFSSSNFFFVRDDTRGGASDNANDTREWVYLVCIRSDMQHKFGALSMRRFPVRMQFKHIRERLLQRSGTLLDLNSDPIIFTALAGTLLAHQLPLIAKAPKHEGMYPVFLPQPQGMFLCYGKPCATDDFNYTYGEFIRWIKDAPLAAPAGKKALPGLGAPMKPALPGLPGITPSSPASRPFLQAALPERCVISEIKPTFFPALELEINTYIDARMMKGAQRGLFNQQLVQLLDDAEFLASTSIIVSTYTIGNIPISQADKAMIGRIAYAENMLRGIILGREWADASKHSIRSYINKTDPLNDPT